MVDVPAVYLQQLYVLGRVLIAMVMGALIGLEREVAHKPAGLRTHILVAGASTLLLTVGVDMVDFQIANIGDVVVRTDPVRIIAAIITGISFLGAGTIIRQSSNGSVKGLTTAASLLLASVVGMYVALSQWVIAIGTTILALLVLRLVPWFERRLQKPHS